MANILGAFGQALISAAQGSSANAFYRELQSLGIGARRSEALSLFKYAKSVTTSNPQEAFRDITQAPSANELTTWTTKSATGIRQNVSLFYRDKATGMIKQTFWSTIGDTAMTREQAIATAIDAYSGNADAYGQDLIGAVHTGAYNLVPDTLLSS
jgi:hypothetical protein